MPIYLDIDRLARTVMIVAHGAIGDHDVRKTVQDLLAADVSSFAKIIDTSAATSQATLEQIAAIAHDARRAGPSGARAGRLRGRRRAPGLRAGLRGAVGPRPAD